VAVERDWTVEPVSRHAVRGPGRGAAADRALPRLCARRPDDQGRWLVSRHAVRGPCRRPNGFALPSLCARRPDDQGRRLVSRHAVRGPAVGRMALLCPAYVRGALMTRDDG
jgi:hypothetical protein